jgi:hypothetical protein
MTINDLTSDDLAAINKRLDRIDRIRVARGKDTVESEQIIAELSIDYGAYVITQIIAGRALTS